MINQHAYPYTTLRDLSAALAEQIGLDREDVARAISNHRLLFCRYEDLHPQGEEFAALARAVWADLTQGAEYPFSGGA